MDPAAVEAFFQDYAAAFSGFDIDRICGLWAYPAYMAARGRRAALEAEAFRANTQALCAFYRAQGMAGASKRVADIVPLFDGLALVRTQDRMVDAEGETIIAWEHAYLLSRTAEGLRAVMAMPDAELDAWQARGAPMGSW